MVESKTSGAPVGSQATGGEIGGHDVSVIRPEVRIEQFKIRGHAMSRRKRRAIRRGLRRLCNLETLAVGVYRYQIHRRMCEHNRELIAAMCNEMTHLQDYMVKLFEYSGRPSWIRGLYGWAGAMVGFGSRLMGRTRSLRAGIWVEKGTIEDYRALLKSVEWDDETRAVIEKNLADEHGHIGRWKELLRTAEPDY
ncbi:MAG: ferritin-like domain-containing protein [Phycisphaerae bacterium]|nr:ferritin-like domain-containing protein [Phycisphaerae bacterium]